MNILVFGYRFDLRTLDANGPEDEEGIKRAAGVVHKMIDDEVKEGIASNKIVIGGFSQGGALAIYSALTYTKPLAGVMALSCWLPLNKTFPEAAVGNLDTPFLQCHGDCDPIVPYKWGQKTASIMKSFLKNTEFKTYSGLMHASSNEVRILILCFQKCYSFSPVGTCLIIVSFFCFFRKWKT